MMSCHFLIDVSLSAIRHVDTCIGLVRYCTRYLETSLSPDSAIQLYESTPEWMDEFQSIRTYVYTHAHICLTCDTFIELSYEKLKSLICSESIGVPEYVIWNALIRWGQGQYVKQEKEKGHVMKRMELAPPEVMKTILGEVTE